MPRSSITNEGGEKKVTTSDGITKVMLDVTLVDSSDTNVVAFIRDANRPYTARSATTATYEYIGLAVPGSATSASLWRISRETIATGELLYADGDANFDNIWDNYTSLSYS